MTGIFVVDQHHEVLTHWAECRRRCGTPPAVLCLDFHTDVLSCLHRNITDPEDLETALKVLHHDEHFDWALRHGIISEALIISLAPCAVLPEHPALKVHHAPELPEINTMLNDPESFRSAAAMVLDDRFLTPLLPENFPPVPYILDIDCDYLLCQAALTPDRAGVIRKLASEAAAITLSREPEWVKILRLPGENISGGSLADELIGFFTPLISCR